MLAGGVLEVRGVLAARDSSGIVRATHHGTDGPALGRALARELRDRLGAG